MRKITLIIALVFSLSAFAQVSLTKNWERSDSLGTRHVWNSGDYTRGIAYGTMGSNERVFLATRHTTARVIILNALTGDSVSIMNMTGVSGGTHAISDAGMTEDGVLLVSNLQTAVSSTSPLKIYKWVNETDAPTVAIQWGPTTSAGRYGDKITVTGKISNGTAKVYAVKNVSGSAEIKYWDMKEDTGNPGTYIFNQDPKDLFSVPNLGVLASVSLRPDGGLYYKINGQQMKQYNSAGVQVGSDSPGTVIASNGNNVKYIADNDLGEAVVCYLRYSTTATANSKLGNHKVDIIRVKENNLTNATFITGTASMGKTANGNGAGGIVLNKLPNNHIELYVLSTNNGIAKYTVSGIFTTTSTNSSNQNILLIRLGDNIIVNGLNPASLIVYNVAGQKIKAVSNNNTVSVEGLRGIHIVKFNVDNKVYTQKVVL